jgi:alpha-L-fucosidase
MNLGPTATGGIPEYESAALHKVGEWIKLHGGDDGPIYQGRPTSIAGEGDDFVLELNGELYLFIFGLTATSDTRAHSSARGPGKRVFKNMPRAYREAAWMDNSESLKTDFDAQAKTLTLNATGYPYGTNTVVRVARMKA